VQVLPQVQPLVRVHRLEVAALDGVDQVLHPDGQIDQLLPATQPRHGRTVFEILFDSKSSPLSQVLSPFARSERYIVA
jgi:hypothetical protein